MSLRSLALAVCWLAACSASGGRGRGPGSSDRLILRGGAIYTLDPARPWASAVVVDAGRIVYVGDDAGAAAYVAPRARLVELHGQMVLPGFHDAHLHPMSGGIRLACDLAGLGSEPEIERALRGCAAASPGAGWLIGSGWSPRAFAAGGPSRGLLDALVPDRPALLTSDDGAAVWVNARALALAGLDPASGVLRDDAAIGRVYQQLPPPTERAYREALARSTARANRAGITSVFDASASPAMLDAYQAADRAGELTVRVAVAQRIDARRGVAQLDELIARRDRLRGRRVRADAAKLFLDGEIASHTAALLAPYADAPDARGELYLPPAELDAIVGRLDAAGIAVHMHVMGDRAVRVGLDAIEAAIRANRPRDRRHQLAHLGLVDAADLPRFAALEVTANVQPIWFHADDPAAAPTAAVLGPARAAAMLPMASLVAAGGRVVIGSDWPGSTLRPLDGLQYAVTRQPLDGSQPALRPAERVSLAAALAAYTRDAAWAAGEDAIDGTIEVGKAADLVVLDRNLFAIDAGSLHTVQVLATLVDGVVVYRDPRLAWP